MVANIIKGIEDATHRGRSEMGRVGVALLFNVAIMLYASGLRADGAPVSIELVKRSALFKIAAPWIITVPVSALLAAMLFFTIRGMMIPKFIP